MGIREDFKEYIDKDGLVQNNPHPPDHNGSGNGLRYTSEYICVLSKHEELNPKDIANFISTIDKCEVTNEPGLYNRSPTHQDQQGPDDLVALASAFSENDIMNGYACALLLYGKEWQPIPYNYNNVMPGTLKHRDGRWNVSAMLIRQPQLIAHFHYAAKQKPPLLAKIAWVTTIAFNGFSKPEDQDGWVLSWHLINAYKNSSHRTWWQDKLVTNWYTKFKKQWPLGMREVLTYYFGYKGHPLAEYWVD